MESGYNNYMKTVIYWLPRILAVLFIAFISMFALDVFSEGYTLNQLLLALFMHLIPSFILTALTIIAWKNERIGGFSFIVAGFALLVFTHFEALIIAIPAFVIGGVFLISSHYRSNKK